MTEIGKLYSCDRCGQTGFAKYIGVNVRDGGFSRRDDFEKLDGWSVLEQKDLCPDCTAEYRKRIAGFWSKKDGANNEK